MAAGKIDVNFLSCDQGMGTLVRIYDKLNTLTNLALLDLGSESGTRKYADKAIESVLTALKQMATPKIDMLIVSHQDFDHWSLLPDLLEKIKTQVPTCKVGAIYYGGTMWRDKATQAVKAWETTFGVTAEPFPKPSTSYGTPGTKVAIKDIDGVLFYLLCANVPISRSAPDLHRNGTSAVVCITFGGVHAVIPGDATADTVGWINDFVFTPWKDAAKGNPVQPCRALGAPHHGALRTIASNYTSSVGSADLGIAKTFADYVSAENVVASAGYYSKFKHPYKEVMEVLGVKAKTDQLEHDFVWYDGTKAEWTQIQKSERGIYTTVTTLDTPPKRTGWFFTITSAGVVSFHIDWDQAEEIRDRGPRVQRTDRYAAEPHQG